MFISTFTTKFSVNMFTNNCSFLNALRRGMHDIMNSFGTTTGWEILTQTRTVCVSLYKVFFFSAKILDRATVVSPWLLSRVLLLLFMCHYHFPEWLLFHMSSIEYTLPFSRPFRSMYYGSGWWYWHTKLEKVLLLDVGGIAKVKVTLLSPIFGSSFLQTCSWIEEEGRKKDVK